jgi:hypothetical protein
LYRRILRTIALAAVLFLLTSCASDVITINTRRDVFAAEAAAERMASPSGAVSQSPEHFLPAGLTAPDKYSRKPAYSDRLAEYAKELVAKSGRSAAFVNAKPAYSRGETVTLTVAGLPDTAYILKIRYKSGYSSAKGLGTATSDSRGYAVWTFKIGNVAADDFTPWFEVSGGGEVIKHYFRAGDGTKKETPAPESVFLAPLLDTNPAPESAAITQPETETKQNPNTTDNPATENPKSEAKGIGTAIEFTNAKASYRRGESVTLTVRGAPDTVYTLKIRYKSGYSTAKGLGEARSDAAGLVSWTFKISSNADTSFEPWLEVTGGGATATAGFRLTDSDGSSDTESSPADSKPAEPVPATTADETTAEIPVTTAAETEPSQNTAQESGGTIKFVGVRDAYARGEIVTVTVIGLPDTLYTLKVRYKSGYSTAKGLEEARSDASGTVLWTFKIGNRTDTEFIPWLEVTGGGETAIRYFTVLG